MDMFQYLGDYMWDALHVMLVKTGLEHVHLVIGTILMKLI